MALLHIYHLIVTVTWKTRTSSRFNSQSYLAKKNGAPLMVSGTGKHPGQFIYSIDLANLFIWTLRVNDDIESVILSGTSLR